MTIQSINSLAPMSKPQGAKGAPQPQTVSFKAEPDTFKASGAIKLDPKMEKNSASAGVALMSAVTGGFAGVMAGDFAALKNVKSSNVLGVGLAVGAAVAGAMFAVANPLARYHAGINTEVKQRVLDSKLDVYDLVGEKAKSLKNDPNATVKEIKDMTKSVSNLDELEKFKYMAQSSASNSTTSALLGAGIGASLASSHARGSK